MRQVNPDGSQFLLLNGGRYHIEIATDSSESTTRYYSIAGQRPAMRNNDGSINYLLGDHLGSVSTVVNTSGEIVSQSRYLPFGELLWEDGTSPTDYTYTGQRSLSDIGLMDYNARFYDPLLGRFTSPDSIVPDPGSVIGYNRFAYVNNNPMIYTDPSGHRLCEDADCREPGPSVNVGTIIDTSINLYNNITNIGWLNSLLQKSGPWYTDTKNTIDAYDAYKTGERRVSVLSLHAQGKVDDVINWLEGGITLSKASSTVYYTPDASMKDRWLAATRIGIFYAKTALIVYGGYRGVKTLASGSSSASSSNLARVGRWMDKAEYVKMVNTGMVQESYTGTTHVAYPEDSYTWYRQTKPGSWYIEFSVDQASVVQTGEGIAKIIGPNSLEGRLAAKKGLPIPQMPEAFDIIFHMIK